MGVSEQSLRARLHQHGLLVSVDARRETLKVRRRVEGDRGQDGACG